MLIQEKITCFGGVGTIKKDNTFVQNNFDRKNYERSPNIRT
jgi:hypothetical protein